MLRGRTAMLLVVAVAACNKFGLSVVADAPDAGDEHALPGGQSATGGEDTSRSPIDANSADSRPDGDTQADGAEANADCEGPGWYEYGKGHPRRLCCAGLQDVYYLSPAYTSVDGNALAVCTRVPSGVHGCVKGTCGDGICEAGEDLKCGCAADCPGAAWGPEWPPPPDASSGSSDASDAGSEDARSCQGDGCTVSGCACSSYADCCSGVCENGFCISPTFCGSNECWVPFGYCRSFAGDASWAECRPMPPTCTGNWSCDCVKADLPCGSKTAACTDTGYELEVNCE